MFSPQKCYRGRHLLTSAYTFPQPQLISDDGYNSNNNNNEYQTEEEGSEGQAGGNAQGRDDPEDIYFDHDFKTMGGPEPAERVKPRTFFEDFRGKKTGEGNLSQELHFLNIYYIRVAKWLAHYSFGLEDSGSNLGADRKELLYLITFLFAVNSLFPILIFYAICLFCILCLVIPWFILYL